MTARGTARGEVDSAQCDFDTAHLFPASCVWDTVHNDHPLGHVPRSEVGTNNRLDFSLELARENVVILDKLQICSIRWNGSGTAVGRAERSVG